MVHTETPDLRIIASEDWTFIVVGFDVVVSDFVVVVVVVVAAAAAAG